MLPGNVSLPTTEVSGQGEGFRAAETTGGGALFPCRDSNTDENYSVLSRKALTVSEILSLQVCLSINPSIRLPNIVCRSDYLSVYLSIDATIQVSFVCLSVYLSI